MITDRDEPSIRTQRQQRESMPSGKISLFIFYKKEVFEMTMKELISKLREADHAYYDLDEPIMSDREYNQLFDQLEQMEKETGIIMSDSPTQRVQYS